VQNQLVHPTTLFTWVNDWSPLLTLLSTLVLLVVTVWLAYLTKVLAAFAKTTEELSRVAVAVAEASTEVRFEVEPRISSDLNDLPEVQELQRKQNSGKASPTDYVDITDDMVQRVRVWREIVLTCKGATVDVHGLRLTSVGAFSVGSGIQKLPRDLYRPDVELISTETLPRTCRAGQVVRFEVRDRPIGEPLASFDAIVSYAFGNGAIRTREVTWSALGHGAPRSDEVSWPPGTRSSPVDSSG
jgi:hypothetical protein